MGSFDFGKDVDDDDGQSVVEIDNKSEDGEDEQVHRNRTFTVTKTSNYNPIADMPLVKNMKNFSIESLEFKTTKLIEKR